jgi:hypothetical protein
VAGPERKIELVGGGNVKVDFTIDELVSPGGSGP